MNNKFAMPNRSCHTLQVCLTLCSDNVELMLNLPIVTSCIKEVCATGVITSMSFSVIENSASHL